MATYIAYKRGEYVGEGTFEELAELTGRSPATLKSVHSRGSRIWEIIRLDVTIPKGTVDNQKILNLIDTLGYTRHEVAEVVGITYSGFNQKLKEYNPWRETEIEELEDLFFLEEGELLK